MSSPSLARYTSLVDWDANGNFTGDHDDVTHYVLPAETITIIGQGRDQARGTAPPQQPRMEQTVINLDRRFSSEYDAGPLAGKLLPGRPTQFRADAGEDWLLNSPDVPMNSAGHFIQGSRDYALFSGIIDSLDENPLLGANTVKLTSHGRMSRLERVRVETQLYASITTGAAMQHLLTAAGLAAPEYAIDSDVLTSGRILAYWYGDGSAALSQAYSLWATEGYSAFFGEDEDGVIVFQGRNYRTLSPRSQNVQATFRDVRLGDDLWHVGFRIHPGIRDVINRPVVEVTQRQAAALDVVWEYGSAVLTLDGTGAARVLASPSEPFIAAVAPTVGGGDFALSAGTVSVALSRPSGASTDIQFSGGSPGATISALRLRAQPMEVTGVVQAETLIDTSASIAAYGERSLVLDALPGIAMTDAVSLCDAMAIAYQEPRPIVEIDLVNGDAAFLATITRLQLGDRIHVVDYWAGADLDVLIEQRRHRISSGRSHAVTFGCEKVVEADWGLYDDGLYGVALFGQ